MQTYRASEIAKKSRRGFTLIELLTVIAIIGILAAIIIPVVGKVRTTAKRAQGMSNLRQINLAGIAYLNENKWMWYHDTNRQNVNQTVDAAYYYPKYLTRYISSQAVTNKPFGEYFYDPMVAVNAPNVMHFAVLRVLFGETNPNNPYNRLHKIKNPSNQVFFADNYINPNTGGGGSTVQDTGFDAFWIGGAMTDAVATSPLPDNYAQQDRYLDLTRDPGQIKLGFLDGHVAILKRQQLVRRIFDPRFNM